MSEWRVIPGYPNYEISEAGAVRRRLRVGSHKAGKIVAPRLKSTGYLCAYLTADGRRHGHHVHRLVALAFLGAPPGPKMHAAHKDGSRQNNHWTNLYWASPAENQRDRKRHGTHLAGSKAPSAKLTEGLVAEMRVLHRGGASIAALARKFAVHWTTAESVVRGETWRHVTV